MKWTKGASEYYWFRGRYYIERSLAFDRNPAGHWIYFGWFKPSKDVDAICLTPERRDEFEQAEADCVTHYRSLSKPSDPQELPDEPGQQMSPPYPSQRHAA